MLNLARSSNVRLAPVVSQLSRSWSSFGSSCHLDVHGPTTLFGRRQHKTLLKLSGHPRVSAVQVSLINFTAIGDTRTYSVKLRRPKRRVALALPCCFDPASVEHAATEGGLVEGAASDGLMHGLEITQSEEVRQQREGKGSVVELAAEPPMRCCNDGGVVECEQLARFCDR